MIYLLKNIECYCPEYVGAKDVLIAGDRIYKMTEPNSHLMEGPAVNSIAGHGLLAFPGMVDGHVHIIGGGGEDGFTSRLPEINRNDVLSAGVTTVVGLLGADNRTKNLNALLAKARALASQGITTFIYTGSYTLPMITMTGDVTDDMVLIDKVIGAGEVAISDHRSSHPDLKDLLELATKTYLGGLISGKAGVVHLHVGDGKSGLRLLTQLLAESDLPIQQFLPTHMNRNQRLFQQAIDYTRAGGNVDLTSGEIDGIPVPDAVQAFIKNDVNLQRVTISSDAGGSSPTGKIGSIKSLYLDVIDSIVQKKLSPELIFPLVTRNAAQRIGLYPRKGTLSEGSDADILITDKNYQIVKVFSMGKLVVDKGEILEEANNAT